MSIMNTLTTLAVSRLPFAVQPECRRKVVIVIALAVDRLPSAVCRTVFPGEITRAHEDRPAKL
jgi:hypothetical protein